jgi:tetratricopeptide (TPR) repeat protein
MKIEELLKKVPIRIFDKGKEILKNGSILGIEKDENTIRAHVKGIYSPEYLVKIKLEGDEVVDWSCSCLYEGNICKHVVGVLLKAAEDRNIKVQRKRRKTKNEITKEIIEKLSHEELKEFVKNYIEIDKHFRDALLSRFSYYADVEAKTIEAKYNAIFRNILNRYKKHGFINYYDTANLGEQIIRFISAGENLVKEGKLEEAFVIAKTAIRNWVKNLENMDDSFGITTNVIGKSLELIVKIYKAGNEKVFDFLINEGKKEVYKDFSIDYDFATALTKMADSPEKAEKVLTFLKTIGCEDELKAELLLKFFPEKYEKFVEERINNPDIVEFHINELLRRKEPQKALDYINRALTVLPFYGQEKILTYKAEILQKLNKTKESLKTYLELFISTKSTGYLLKAKKLSSPEEWKKIREISKKILEGMPLIEFLIYEEDYEGVVEEMKKMKEEFSNDLDSLEVGFSIAKKLPKKTRDEVIELLLDSSFNLFDRITNRNFYRNFFSMIENYSNIIGKERIIAILKELLERYPTRRALREEIKEFWSSI